jgi:acyl carrier protein
MIPSAFVLMEKFPLNANGKIDRQAFPDVTRENLSPVHMPAKPQTDTERELAAIWAELLDLESVGVDEDFFDLGGHSLLAIRAVSRAREKFEVNVSLRNLLESPTVAGLARVIDGLSWLARSKMPAQSGGSREEIAL